MNRTFRSLQCRIYLKWVKQKRASYIINEPSHAYHLVKDELMASDREVFLSILVTAKNEVIGIETIAIGTISTCLVHPREVFKGALMGNCFGIILCHNHPSGDATPSDTDIEMTERIVHAGAILGIEVFDHIIVGRDSYTSLKELNHLQASGKSILAAVHKAAST